MNLMPYIMRVANGHLPFLAQFLGVFGNDYNTVDGTGQESETISMLPILLRVTLWLSTKIKKALKKYEECNFNGYHVFNLGTGNGTSVSPPTSRCL